MPTVAQLLAAGAQVTARCHECGAVEAVDLQRLAAEAGPDLDLTDRHPPCRRCSYWLGFYAASGQRTRALTTREGDRAESRRRTAWLFSASAGRRGPVNEKAPAGGPAGALSSGLRRGSSPPA